MRSNWRTLVPAIVAFLVLAACGDNDSAVPSGVGAIEQLPIDATLALPGLGAPTDVVSDELGMSHVYAPDVQTAVFLEGYLCAASRFWEMDSFRRFAEGRLSELLGRLALDTDIGMRTVFTTRDGRRLEEALWEHTQAVDPELTGILQAYAGGVNAWLSDLRAGRNGATLPPEYTIRFPLNERPETLADWRPQDTLAIGRLQAWLLSETLEEEVARARLVAALPEDVVRDVFRSAPAAPATVLPATGATARPATLTHAREGSRLASAAAPNMGAVVAALGELRRRNPLGSRALGVGSNNWIVSPALSANGHAMLANDPHLALYNPPVWFMIELETVPGAAEHLRANGVIFPGLPGVILGNNDMGAWGATVAYFDVTDVYLEQVTTPPDYPASPRTVLFQGQQVPVQRIEETFRIKNGGSTKRVIEIVPHHGPMVPDPDPSDAVVGLAATNMSFRWTGHEITNDARFLLDLNKARNVNEFRAALESFAVGAQNWVWADVHGDIAYYPRVLIPQRPKGTVPYLPMPGTGEAEWLTDAQGNTLWLPDEQIPQATNPPQGYLNTSNNDQIGNTLDNDPLNDEIYLAFTADLGFRAQRVQELLSNAANVRPPGAKITVADMSAYQYDHSSKEAARLLPFLFAAATARPDLVTPAMLDALNRLRAWGETKPASPPYDTASGIDAHDLRDDVPARSVPVTDEERTAAVATSIFAAWETRLAPAVFQDDLGAYTPHDDDATKALLHILEDVDRTDPGWRVYTKGTNGESTLWDDQTTPQVETRDEVLLIALQDALTFLQDRFTQSGLAPPCLSAQPDGWLWGCLHQVRFEHLLSSGGIGVFNLGPFPAPGARYTVNPANYNLDLTGNFVFSTGPSQRYVAVLDPAGIRAVNAFPGGNNGNPGGMGADNYQRLDPALHYGDLIPGWINGETFEYHISPADVAAHAVRKVRYTP